MKRLLMARMVLTAIGVAVWWTGKEDERLRLAGMAIIAVAILLRFLPRRWFGDAPE
jgi:hypothetical protein